MKKLYNKQIEPKMMIMLLHSDKNDEEFKKHTCAFISIEYEPNNECDWSMIE